MIETPEIVGVTTDEASIMLPSGTFNLYRQSEDTGWDLLAPDVSGKYTDYDVAPGKTYDYSIREVKDDVEGHRSDVFEAVIPDMPVEAVTDWNPDSNTAEATLSLPDMGTYNIYRDGELVGTSDGSDTYLDEDLEGDQEYSYQVAKINDGVEGTLTDAVDVTAPSSDQMDNLEELGIDTSQLDESDLESMGLADIDMNDPDERKLAMDILRNEIGTTLQDDMIDASSELKDGGSADSWWLKIAGLLAGGLTLAGLIGAGGTDNFDEAARKNTEAEAADQFDYLDGFADDVAVGKQSSAQIDARLGLYGNALGSVASSVRHSDALNNFKFARRNLMFGAQHCKNCVAYAGYWMPIEDCPPIGENCQCGVSCLCDIEYSETDPRNTGEEEVNTVDESPQDYANKLAEKWDFSELSGADPEFIAAFDLADAIANTELNPSEVKEKEENHLLVNLAVEFFCQQSVQKNIDDK